MQHVMVAVAVVAGGHFGGRIRPPQGHGFAVIGIPVVLKPIRVALAAGLIGLGFEVATLGGFNLVGGVALNADRAARIALRHGAEDRRKEVVRDFAAPSRYDRSVIHRYQELAPQHWPGVEAAFSKVCRRYYDVARVKVVGEIVDKAMAEAQLEGEIIEGRQIEAFEAAFGKGVERYLLREDHSQEVALEDLFGDAGVPSVG